MILSNILQTRNKAMKNLFIYYKLIIRKLYNKKTRGWRAAACNLSFILIILHILTFLLLFEAIFDVKGIVYLSINKKLPLAPIAAGLFLVLYFIIKVIFKKSQKDKKFREIKSVLIYVKNISKNTIIWILVFSIILFIGSIILNVI